MALSVDQAARPLAQAIKTAEIFALPLAWRSLILLINAAFLPGRWGEVHYLSTKCTKRNQTRFFIEKALDTMGAYL
ncbi:hypothetical protein PANT111_100163 [Pantoea brenneri]|uniref:Transposase n=1 Tax=Pantoea brenneri TaxID=472694 RepID=A0AAX3J0K0_9GAMM|nr:hypothetical protein PANT111_100163 [Pantoea brenneri]